MVSCRQIGQKDALAGGVCRYLEKQTPSQHQSFERPDQVYAAALQLLESSYRASAERRVPTPHLAALRRLGLQVPYLIDDGDVTTTKDADFLARGAHEVGRIRSMLLASGLGDCSPDYERKMAEALYTFLFRPTPQGGAGKVYASERDVVQSAAEAASDPVLQCNSMSALYAGLALLAGLDVQFRLEQTPGNVHHIYPIVHLSGTSQVVACNLVDPCEVVAAQVLPEGTRPISRLQFLGVFQSNRTVYASNWPRGTNLLRWQLARVNDSLRFAPDVGFVHLNAAYLYLRNAEGPIPSGRAKGIFHMYRATALEPRAPWAGRVVSILEYLK